MRQQKICSVVLAAGKSTRFGKTKQLALLHGESLVGRASTAAEQLTGHSTLLVVGHERQAVLEACLPMRGFFVFNERYADGMSTSIAAAAAALDGISDALLLLLADQPLVPADHLTALRSAWLENPDTIVASRFANVIGPPVIFPARMFGELRSLKGDRGARALLNSGAEDIVAIDCDAAAIDIDTPEALDNIS